jgi:predicted dehydrogenase
MKARQAGKLWNVDHIYSDPQSMFSDIAVDIAVVAVSTASRSLVISPALAAKVGVLVIEKPLAATFAESEELAKSIRSSGVKNIVNYSRRWDPSMRQWREAIREGKLGSI